LRTPNDGGSEEQEMSSLLIHDYPLMVSPKLAARIGLYEAHFLQQIHWLCEKSKNIRDGKAWVYNTYEQWLEHFPFMEKQQIGRIVRKLEKMGVLVTTDEYNRHGLDNTKWYRVNYASPILDFSTEPAEGSNLNDEDSDLNTEGSSVNLMDSAVNAGSSNLNQQLPETFHTDLPIDFLQVGDGASPAAAEPEFQLAEIQTAKPAKPKTKSEPNPDNVATWQAYARAYRDRYGVLPASNAKTRGQTAQLVRFVGREIAPHLAAYFVSHNNRWFVQSRHEIGCLLRAYQQVLTDMQRGEQMTQAKAQQAERTQGNLDAVMQSDDIAAWERYQRKQQGAAA